MVLCLLFLLSPANTFKHISCSIYKYIILNYFIYVGCSKKEITSLAFISSSCLGIQVTNVYIYFYYFNSHTKSKFICYSNNKSTEKNFFLLIVFGLKYACKIYIPSFLSMEFSYTHAIII